MAIAANPSTSTLALIGNPNVGKSTLFSVLAGIHQRVGNYPGVTVEKKVGLLRLDSGHKVTLIDLPGTYSLAPRSQDEMVAVDVLLGRQDDVEPPDVILCVVDASNLERNLYLVSQVRELGRRIVVALNMVDVAERRGITVDLKRLQEHLGVPVVAIQANTKRGIDELRATLQRTLDQPSPDPLNPLPPAFVEEVDRIVEAQADRPEDQRLPRYMIERLLLDVGGYIEGHLPPGASDDLLQRVGQARRRLEEAGHPVPAVEAIARYAWIGQATGEAVTRNEPQTSSVSMGDRVDALLTHKVWGSLIFLMVMVLIFQSVFTWAGPAMDLIESVVGLAGEATGSLLAEGALRSLVVDGIFAGVGGVVVFLPQIFVLFFFLAILEDCGYLARAAYLMDRIMTRLGLSGKSFIPLLSSFACAIPGIMATRVIEDRRDRLATILVAPLMSCSARLPVYTLMIAAFIPATTLFGFLSLQAVTMVTMYAIGVVTAGLVAWALKRTMLKGPTPAFVMELPPYKWPSLKTVVLRMLDRGWAFIRRAGTIILAVSIIMWALLYYPRLPEDQHQALEAERFVLVESQAELDDPEAIAAIDDQLADLDVREDSLQKRQSLLGRAGRLIEPAVEPLGWDWRIGAATIASFPAREVVVATLGVIFDVGEEVEDEQGEVRLSEALRQARRPDKPDRPLFDIPVALSIMVFFALCAQCVSTLAIIKHETNSWAWPSFAFFYMTGLAYIAALITYQVGAALGL